MERVLTSEDDKKRLSEHGSHFVAFVFRKLDDIRASGEINMMAASSILQNSGVDRKDARALANGWMETFNHEQDAILRAEIATGEWQWKPEPATKRKITV